MTTDSREDGVPPRIVSLRGLGAPVALVCVTVVIMLLGFTLKADCLGYRRFLCYSDVLGFWDWRDVASHQFPYLHGGLDSDGSPFGGTYEYPVITGVYIWFTSLFATNAQDFLRVNAAGALILGAAITVLLWQLCGRRALWWVCAPALVLYPILNWDLPAVLFTVAGVWAMHRNGLTRRQRGVLSAALFGLGFATKIYPGFFVLPLVLHLALDGPGDTRTRVRDAVSAAGSAIAAVLVVNVPFMLLGFQGWWASIEFQRQRKPDVTTNSLWYWGFRPGLGETATYHHFVDVLSPLLVLTSFVVICFAAWRIRRPQAAGLSSAGNDHQLGGVGYRSAASAVRGHADFPWVQAGAAMLAAFLVFHKVDSPQYALWLMPFFALVRVPIAATLTYIVANLCVGVGYFMYTSNQAPGAEVLLLGVWGQVLVLTLLIPLFLLGSRSTETTVPTQEALAPRTI